MSQKQKQNKDEKEGERRRAIKDQIDKRRKGNKTLSQKSEKGQNFFFDKRQ
jgi:type II secretory pathway pseudopilin PulG